MTGKAPRAYAFGVFLTEESRELNCYALCTNLSKKIDKCMQNR